MNECICCRDRLLRQISHRRMYWFCPNCNQEMPHADDLKIYDSRKAKRQLIPSLLSRSIS